jgi:hypothetical protein
MHLGEASVISSVAQPHGVQRPLDESLAPRPVASLRDTIVFLFAVGAIVIGGCLATVVALHPISGRAIVAGAMETIAHW